MELASLVISTLMSVLFLPRLTLGIIRNDGGMFANLKTCFSGLLNIRETLFLLSHVPILFYISSICSTTVLLVFSKMLIKSDIHIPTFCIALSTFFIFGIIVRYVTLKLVSIELKEDGGFGHSRIMSYIYIIMLLPAFLDTNNFRQTLKHMIFVDPTYYPGIVSSILICLIFIFCAYMKKWIQYLSTGVMLMFITVLASVLYNFDINHLLGIFNIPNNTLNLTGIIRAILYANLFAIFSNDLYCLCMERSVVNYTKTYLIPNNVIKEDQQDKFYLLTSIIVSLLAFIWLVVFLNIGATDVLTAGSQAVHKIVKMSISTIFFIMAIMQAYIIIDYVYSFRRRLLALLVILIGNMLWFEDIAYVAVVIFLLGQAATSINLTFKIKK